MTWQQLDSAARTDRLELFRSAFGVTIYTTDSFRTPLVTISAGDLTDEDNDRLLRATTAAAMRVLKEMNP